MNGKLSYILVALVLIVGLFGVTGCVSSDIDRKDLDLVNAYISQLGYNEIELDDAIFLNKAIFQNSDTNEKKSNWDLVVDYVKNIRSDKPIELDYSIIFGKDSIEFDNNNVWEHIEE